jgi:hypothetical protein
LDEALQQQAATAEVLKDDDRTRPSRSNRRECGCSNVDHRTDRRLQCADKVIADGIAIAFIVVMLAVLILEAAIAFIR